MPGINVVYNGTSIQTNNILVNSIDYDSIPAKTSSQFALARSHRSAITASYYQSKLITIGGTIIGTSVADAESRADAFKAAMNPAANTANLDIDYNGSTRRFAVTVQMCALTRTNAMFAIGYSLQFVALDPFGTNTTSTTLINAAAISASPSTQSPTFIGNFIEQYPVITYTLTSFTGSATNTIYFKNNTTGQQISIARTWTAADVLVIDTFNRTVTVNGVATDYDGVFPPFAPGAGSLIVTDNFTTRAATITVTQLARFW